MTAVAAHVDEQDCKCVVCATRLAFDLPPEIVDACMARELVLFAGAGISTESRLVLPGTFYDEIRYDLGVKATDSPDFPELMGQFERRHGRGALLKKIKARLDYVKSFPELDEAASRFHRELATIYPISEIFTTNWDTYFESRCAATPYVTEQDWALWRETDRKVFKLHGSMTNLGSVIATSSDYARCYRALNRGLLGATLKTMLATKTVVFGGPWRA